MSTLDLDSGRSRQKLRTRDALVAAARDLLSDGATLTIELVAERAKAAGVSAVVFDRGGDKYHGRLAALADAARENGLDF